MHVPSETARDMVPGDMCMALGVMRDLCALDV
jgi:hypothetical protein